MGARSIDTHRPDCPCPACGRRREREARGEESLALVGVRLPQELREWVMAQGGSAFVRGLIERARAEEAEPAPES